MTRDDLLQLLKTDQELRDALLAYKTDEEQVRARAEAQNLIQGVLEATGIPRESRG